MIIVYQKEQIENTVLKYRGQDCFQGPGNLMIHLLSTVVLQSSSITVIMMNNI